MLRISSLLTSVLFGEHLTLLPGPESESQYSQGAVRGDWHAETSLLSSWLITSLLLPPCPGQHKETRWSRDLPKNANLSRAACDRLMLHQILMRLFCHSFDFRLYPKGGYTFKMMLFRCLGNNSECFLSDITLFNTLSRISSSRILSGGSGIRLEFSTLFVEFVGYLCRTIASLFLGLKV